MSIIHFQNWQPAHLSYSTISTYRMCSRKTYFEKVLLLEQRPGLAAIAGNAVHTATEAIDRQIFEQGWGVLDDDPPTPEVVDDTPAPF